MSKHDVNKVTGLTVYTTIPQSMKMQKCAHERVHERVMEIVQRASTVSHPPPSPLSLVWDDKNGHHYGHCNYTVVSDCCWSQAADQKERIYID